MNQQNREISQKYLESQLKFQAEKMERLASETARWANLLDVHFAKFKSLQKKDCNTKDIKDKD